MIYCHIIFVAIFMVLCFALSSDLFFFLLVLLINHTKLALLRRPSKTFSYKFRKSQKKSPLMESIFNVNNEALAQVISCDFRETIRNNYLLEHQLTVASDCEVAVKQ